MLFDRLFFDGCGAPTIHLDGSAVEEKRGEARRSAVQRCAVIRRDPAEKGFKVIPRRWAVELTFGRLMHRRRLARDCDTHPHRSEAIAKLATVDLTSRRPGREATANWRDT